MKDKWKQLIFRCNGHVFVLRFRPADGIEGPAKALVSWLENPEVDFNDDDLDRLSTILQCACTAYGP